MKNLNAFSRFALSEFLESKDLTVIACTPWVDFDSKAVQGTKVEVAITRDDTPYPPTKDGTPVTTNLYERLSIKVPKDISVPLGSLVTVINGTGNVYGDYRNQLSVRAEDVKIITPPSPPAKGAEKVA